MNIKEFRQFLKEAKKQGVTEFKLGDLAVKFSPDVIQAPKSAQTEPIQENLAPQYSDFDTLMWSVHDTSNLEAN